MNKTRTWGDLMDKFRNQFPELKTYDWRPNNPHELYIWLEDSPDNIIATFNPETDTFQTRRTNEDWNMLERGRP